MPRAFSELLAPESGREVAGPSGAVDSTFHREHTSVGREPAGPLLFAGAGNLASELDEKTLLPAVDGAGVRGTGIGEHSGNRAATLLTYNIEASGRSGTVALCRPVPRSCDSRRSARGARRGI